MIDPKTTTFGFQKVTPEQKTPLVTDVFHRVARRYDLMNDVMSAGIHRIWKNQLIHRMKSSSGAHLLDMAGGTGDIALRFLETYPHTHVTVCDINPSMIEVGRDRALNHAFVKNLEWIGGDASALPFNALTFDLYSIAFGLRNVTFRAQALDEAFRVLKPGGKFFCLEFSQVQWAGLRTFYKFYSFSIIPRLGAAIANDHAAYQYLVESIAQFPNQEKLKQEIEQAGFRSVKVRNLTGGIVAIHQGEKPL